VTIECAWHTFISDSEFYVDAMLNIKEQSDKEDQRTRVEIELLNRKSIVV
jgi:hypothetical protein